MEHASAVTKYELIDALTAVSAANGLPVKYVKEGDFQLSRLECARLCQAMLHLPDRPCQLPDVSPQSYGAGAVGAVVQAGLMPLADGAFQGHRLVTRAEQEALLTACDRYLKAWRAGLKPFRATALQFNPRMYRREENIDRLYAEVEKAFAAGSKLVVAPETATSAYVYFDRAELAPYVDVVPGPVTDRFAALAAQYHSYVSFGVAEMDPDTGDFYNTAVLVGPEG